MIKKLLTYLNATDGSLKTKTIRGAFWVGLSNITLSALSFVRSIVLARLLTPEVFGLWAICLMFIRGVNVFTETGFGAALIHRQHDFHEARNTAFTLMVLRGVILSLISLGMAPLFAIFFEQEILHPLISALALAFVFSGFHNINTVYHQRELHFRYLVYLEQSQTVVNFFLVVSLAYVFRSVWALVLGHIISCLLNMILSYIVIPGRPKLALDKTIALELFHYGKYITGLTIVLFITTELDNAVIGKTLGMEALGVYSLAYMLANLPTTHFSKILSNILFPAYSKLQNDVPALRAALMRAIRFVSLVTVPVSFLFIAIAREIIEVLYGEKWLAAVGPFQVLAIFGLLRGISGLNGYLYNAIGKPHINFYTNLGKLIVIALVIIPLTSEYGVLGTAIAVTIPAFLQYFVDLVIARRVIGIKVVSVIVLLSRHMFKSGVMVLAVTYLTTFIDRISVISLAGLVITAMLIYSVLSIREIREFFLFILSKKKEGKQSAL